METTENRSDLRNTRCKECGAHCVPGQTHLEHNAGWKKKMLMLDWHELCCDKWPGWHSVTSPNGEKHPPFVKLAIRNDFDKSSLDIDREFDNIATGKFYSRDFSRDGSVFVNKGDWYDAGWWFEKLEDAYTFIKKYGGNAE